MNDLLDHALDINLKTTEEMVRLSNELTALREENARLRAALEKVLSYRSGEEPMDKAALVRYLAKVREIARTALRDIEGED